MAEAATALSGGELNQEQGKKRKAPLSWEEGIQKVRKTIGWYNKNGGLASAIHYRTVAPYLEALNPREALKILKELEEKGDTIRDPTAWIKRAAENKGPELDKKVRTTIAWYNKQGNLQEQIKYDEVREALGYLSPGSALKVIGGLEGKEDQIKNPTGWICKAAWNAVEREGTVTWEPPKVVRAGGRAGGGKAGGKGTVLAIANAAAPGRSAGAAAPVGGGGKGQFDGSLDPKVKKTIGWYNKKGGLQAEIRFDEVAPVLAEVGTQQALQILQGLDPEKGGNSTVKNPTGWIKKAAQNLLG